MTEDDRLPPQHEPGKWASIGLAIFVHGMLLVLLFFGIRWQTRAPEAVEVAVYRASPATQAAARPAPRPEPKREMKPEPRPKPEPKPEAKPAPIPPRPPKPAPRPTPRPAIKPAPTPPPPKPVIAVKEKTRPKPPRPEPRPMPPLPPPPPTPTPRVDEMRQQKLLEEQLRRDSQQLAQARMQREAEHEMTMLREQETAATLARDRADWTDRIRQKIRGNIVVPPGVLGNPEAVFDVSLLPDASVLNVRLRKSSGNSALDAAIERAIRKSSPLPKPEQGAVERELNLRFRPLEE